MPDNGLPEGWRVAELGEIVRPVGTRRGEQAEPVVLSCSKDYGLVPQLSLFGKRLASADTRRYKVAEPGDFVFDSNLLWSGSIARNHQGVRGIVSPVYEVFRIRDGHSPEFLEYWLKNPARLRQFGNISDGTNVRRRKAPFDEFAKLRLLLPPPDEQRKIAEVLDSIDGAIEKTEAVIAATESLRSALLGELLTRGVPGWHTEWEQVPGIGTIPACWDVVRLGDCGKWLSGGTPSKARADFWTGPTPWVSPKDMKVRVISDAEDHISHEAAADLRCVGPGTILVVVRGMILAHSFPAAVTSREVAFNQDMRALVCRKGIVPDYLLAYLESRRDSLVRLATPSTHGTMRVVSEELFAVQVPLPDEREQKRICEAIGALDQRDKIEQRSLGNLMALKSATSEALLCGRIRV